MTTSINNSDELDVKREMTRAISLLLLIVRCVPI
eukprot:CAMPEP_0202492306 /NCGR_PEP_ID=MMETSP1361-20130828/9072_1 /ASSEMBLY_ACC=CAM_ASM_000849 /TAXON_ID=210615 /ORGANISM="Staurosira complex sp., Strain CCMP2646" /LENGTH=33 /DNA_ID= /DNA_START= /DNA_END= /DNA_ORIENTATION=